MRRAAGGHPYCTMRRSVVLALLCAAARGRSRRGGRPASRRAVEPRPDRGRRRARDLDRRGRGRSRSSTPACRPTTPTSRAASGRATTSSSATPRPRTATATARTCSGSSARPTGNGVGVESVAPAATLMPIRVLGDDGGGSVDDVATRHRLRAHPRRRRDQPLARQRGAAGRRRRGRRARRGDPARDRGRDRGGRPPRATTRVPVCEQPAAGEGLLCVGAVDKRRQRSFFSSFGSGLGLVAPGGSGASAAGMEVGEDVLSTFEGLGLPRARGHLAGRPARVRGRRAARGARRARPGRGQAHPRHRDRPRPARQRRRVRRRARERSRGGRGPRRRPAAGPAGSGSPAGTRRALSPFVRVKRRQRARTRAAPRHPGARPVGALGAGARAGDLARSRWWPAARGGCAPSARRPSSRA